jgi:sialic acid synthase SpsE
MLKIGNRIIDRMHAPYYLAEIGLNHGGDRELALQMVEAAAECGAHGIKLQTYITEEFVKKDSPAYFVLKPCELSLDVHREIAELCRKLQIDFISTPFGISCVKPLLEMGVSALKIASGDMNYYDLVEKAFQSDLPVIISTGMAAPEEISSLMNQDFVDKERTVLLHCVSNYPPKLEDVHLNFISYLNGEYECPVGLSDHTMGPIVPAGAVALGARFIEKHFTIGRELPGPDNKMSMLPHEFKEMIHYCEDIFRCLGQFNKPEITDEKPVKEIARRGLYPKRPLKEGEVLSNDNAIFMRPANSISPEKVRLSAKNSRVKCDVTDEIKCSDLEFLD